MSELSLFARVVSFYYHHPKGRLGKGIPPSPFPSSLPLSFDSFLFPFFPSNPFHYSIQVYLVKGIIHRPSKQTNTNERKK